MHRHRQGVYHTGICRGAKEFPAPRHARPPSRYRQARATQLTAPVRAEQVSVRLDKLSGVWRLKPPTGEEPGIELELDRLCLAYDGFAGTGDTASRLALSVADFEVRLRVTPASPERASSST